MVPSREPKAWAALPGAEGPGSRISLGLEEGMDSARAGQSSGLRAGQLGLLALAALLASAPHDNLIASLRETSFLWLPGVGCL